MSNKVNVVNNVGDNVAVTIDDKNGSVQIVINPVFKKPDLSNLKQGDIFRGRSGTEYILWYIRENGNKRILRKDLLPKDMKFGSNNNFDGSKVDEYLNTTYIKDVEYDFGAENIVEHEVDLFSLDGENDYGIVKRKISIPTIDEYRGHKKTIGKNMERAWWLSTPDSTPSGYGSKCVRCVRSGGDVDYNWCGSSCGVRPVFEIL